MQGGKASDGGVTESLPEFRAVAQEQRCFYCSSPSSSASRPMLIRSASGRRVRRMSSASPTATNRNPVGLTAQASRAATGLQPQGLFMAVILRQARLSKNVCTPSSILLDYPWTIVRAARRKQYLAALDVEYTIPARRICLRRLQLRPVALPQGRHRRADLGNPERHYRRRQGDARNDREIICMDLVQK